MSAQNIGSLSDKDGGIQHGNQRKWMCLDAEGVIVGYLYGETPSKAVEEFVGRKTVSDSFRRPVFTLVNGGVRLNVQNLNA